MSSKIKVGDHVRIPEMEEGEETNREFNVYEIAGRNKLGWIWLSLIRFKVEYEDNPAGLDHEWVEEGYDGYNGDMIVMPCPDPGHEDEWNLVIADDRCRLWFFSGAGSSTSFKLEIVGGTGQ